LCLATGVHTGCQAELPPPATPCPPRGPLLAGGPDPPHLAVQLPQPALQAAARLQVHPHRHAAPLMMMQEVVVVVMAVVQEVV